VYDGMRSILINIVTAILLLLVVVSSSADRLLVPMDEAQTDHLRAYGVAYDALGTGRTVEWLLNYRGGSFLIPFYEDIERQCRLRNVAFVVVSEAGAASVYAAMDTANMDVVLLEKQPRIAVYAPPTNDPWDDAVTLVLAYADIPYDVVYDDEVLSGKLHDYDWLHLHHEDFTGQYGKFYASYRNELWYRQEVAFNEALARGLGFGKVSELKGAVACSIVAYVAAGGFLFSMCSGTDTFDIALAAEDVDIVPAEFDGDPVDPNAQERLDYGRSLAFTDFSIITDPLRYEFSDIDMTEDRRVIRLTPDADFFVLFEFSAKHDPVPTMLTQCHTPYVPGFMGQTTGFRPSLVKKSVTILGRTAAFDEVRYLHGNFGSGTFTFLSGHDPEDYQHLVGDPPTDLSLHTNSPGYRLILNNVLFPAARKKERKT
jgi:hypothetical protein